MPCEDCHIQFTVFRRKKSCSDCKRFYCGNCLSPFKRQQNVTIFLCDKCAIFSKRPLLRNDLLKLKPKDLIFYLQSKHINTSGCVEKDELVGLVLNHVQQQQQQQPDGIYNRSSSSTRSSFANNVNHTNTGIHSETSSNSFDSLKQSCQNFFSNITDNITDSLSSSFDSKGTTKRNQNQNYFTTDGNTNMESDVPTHIFDQPRVSRREMPSYASFQQQQQQQPPQRQRQTEQDRQDVQSQQSTTSGLPLSPRKNVEGGPQSSSSSSAFTSNNPSSQTTSPIISHNNSITSLQPEDNPNSSNGNKEQLTNAAPNENLDNCECDCSDDPDDDDDDVDDDELLVSFQQRSEGKPETEKSNNIEDNNNEIDITSQSSFEELGAIGGISDDSKTATDTNSSNMDQWQILDLQRNPEILDCTIEPVDDNSKKEEDTEEKIQQQQRTTTEDNTKIKNTKENTDNDETNHPPPPPAVSKNSLTLNVIPSNLSTTLPPCQAAVKKVLRRRSESYLNRRKQQHSDEESPTYSGYAGHFENSRITEQDETNGVEQSSTSVVNNGRENNAEDILSSSGSRKTGRRTNCPRCGKNKKNFKRQIERMRRHLESAQMSEIDIKRELADLLIYMENRTKSMDCSDSETPASSVLSGGAGAGNFYQQPITPSFSDADGFLEFDNNEGIHVYAVPAGYNNENHQTRFINLDDFHTIEEIESLSVKQLKEILILNRVDFKGCVEKQELLERVKRIWDNLKTAPAVEKLPTDELCKICMDARIECVFLECGHMATCTNCGKVLSECPICRQYIVRVVRFFRA